MFEDGTPKFLIPHVWVLVDGALVRRPVTGLDTWLFWKEETERIISEWPETVTPKSRYLRLGQKLLNLLSHHGRYDLQFKITGMLNVDPFHSDDNIPAFLEMVDDMWERYWG